QFLQVQNVCAGGPNSGLACQSSASCGGATCLRQARFMFPPELIPAGSSPIYLGTGSYLAFDLDNLQAGIQLSWLDDDAQGRPGLRFTIRDADLYLDIFFATVIEDF